MSGRSRLKQADRGWHSGGDSNRGAMQSGLIKRNAGVAPDKQRYRALTSTGPLKLTPLTSSQRRGTAKS